MTTPAVDVAMEDQLRAAVDSLARALGLSVVDWSDLNFSEAREALLSGMLPVMVPVVLPSGEVVVRVAVMRKSAR